MNFKLKLNKTAVQTQDSRTQPLKQKLQRRKTPKAELSGEKQIGIRREGSLPQDLLRPSPSPSSPKAPPF
ncbi:hypothetical protein SLEP1_g48725 [Rubroshorea leprosula]|uniref:Uncharacterized protein n=1 Tax=Rubroshorea leprosula TaxID=152421 RepID=A0AAV5LXK9_9ROSI|nr:hypothetical protein SLEP1_g48725 [Rubroshorea leprosula]